MPLRVCFLLCCRFLLCHSVCFLFAVCVCVCVCVFVCVWQTVYLSIYLPIYPSIYPSIWVARAVPASEQKRDEMPLKIAVKFFSLALEAKVDHLLSQRAAGITNLAMYCHTKSKEAIYSHRWVY